MNLFSYQGPDGLQLTIQSSQQFGSTGHSLSESKRTPGYLVIKRFSVCVCVWGSTCCMGMQRPWEMLTVFLYHYPSQLRPSLTEPGTLPARLASQLVPGIFRNAGDKKYKLPHTTFSLGPWDPNSGSHSCLCEKHLPIELSPQPFVLSSQG